MALTDQELLLVLESDKGFEIIFVDDEDALENLAGATEASFLVRESETATVDLIVRRSDVVGDLTIDTVNSKLVCKELQAAERLTLAPGVYIGFAAFKLTSGKWYHAEPFRVRFTTSKAPVF